MSHVAFAKGLSLLILFFIANTSLANGENLSIHRVFSLLNNSHPDTGKPVFERGGIEPERLQQYLQDFSAAYSALTSAEQVKIGQQYLEQILSLPFRVGWQAAHYLPMMYLENDRSPRILIAGSVASQTVFRFIIKHFNDLSVGGDANAINRPHLRTVITALGLNQTVADLIGSESQLPSWHPDLTGAGVDTFAFAKFAVDLGLELAMKNESFLKDGDVHLAIKKLAQSPSSSHGHLSAISLERDRAEHLTRLECQEAMLRRFKF